MSWCQTGLLDGMQQWTSQWSILCRRPPWFMLPLHKDMRFLWHEELPRTAGGKELCSFPWLLSHLVAGIQQFWERWKSWVLLWLVRLGRRKERQWGTCGADWASCCNVVTRPSLLLQQLSPPNISRDCSNCHWGDHSLAEFIYSWFALKCNTHNENFPFQANFSPLQRLFSSF